MSFYTILNTVNGLLLEQGWHLHRCRRHGTDTLHYYIADAQGKTITPNANRRRIGLTLDELLEWLEQHAQNYIIKHQARELRKQIIETT